MCVSVCECVCERERDKDSKESEKEHERERDFTSKYQCTFFLLSVTKSSTFQTSERHSINNEPAHSSSTNPDRISVGLANPHYGERGNGTRKRSGDCKSTWKLNGNTFHNCTSQAVRGKCICAIEIEPSTRF